jgi:hypothetical protein
MVMGVTFRSPLVTVGFLMMSIVSITLLACNSGLIKPGEPGDIVFSILILSPLLVGMGVILILSNWTWDYRWLVLAGFVIAVVYFVFILNKVIDTWSIVSNG